MPIESKINGHAMAILRTTVTRTLAKVMMQLLNGRASNRSRAGVGLTVFRVIDETEVLDDSQLEMIQLTFPFCEINEKATHCLARFNHYGVVVIKNIAALFQPGCQKIATLVSTRKIKFENQI